jgi:hypothetical protein
MRAFRGRRGRSILESFGQFQIRLVILQQSSTRDPFVPPTLRYQKLRTIRQKRDRNSRLFPSLVVYEEVRSSCPSCYVPVVEFEDLGLVYHGSMVAKYALILSEGRG